MLAFAFDCGIMLSEYPFFSNFYGRSDAKKAHGSDLDAFFAYFFVNTILELCKPRESIFQSNYTDDVISITNLTNGKISGSAFFEETYLTDGMKRLFDTAFRRFNGEDVTPIVRLKQAMGGGKSHNMVALALLAMNPGLRAGNLPSRFEAFNKPVRVISFYGRECNDCFWHSFADQLGDKSFKTQFGSTQAPGKGAWAELLKGEPLLILLDEMPPYLDYARTQQSGLGTLADVYTHALNNLFCAVAEDLTNVFLVISDLNAAYESGSRLIEQSFENLNKELERHCQDIEPVQSTNDDLYHILRKKLFRELPPLEDVLPVAEEYRSEFSRAKKASLISSSGDTIKAGIMSSYPFHPDLKALFARFQCNQNFQQTRGILRLMRAVLRNIYENHRSEDIKLISACHIDLRDPEIYNILSGVAPALNNAVAKDIADNGNATAEQISSERQNYVALYLARTIYISSLSEAKETAVGLSKGQIFEQVIYPGYVMNDLSECLVALRDNAWYLHESADHLFLFKSVQNVSAQVNNRARCYNDDHVEDLLRKTLEKKISENRSFDIFQDYLIYPGLDDIQAKHCRDKVLLVMYKPHRPGLSPELKEYWDRCEYKNRIMFLSSERDAVDSMYSNAKRMKACDAVKSDIQSNPDGLQPNDNRISQLDEIREKAEKGFFSAAQQSLSLLFYPSAGNTLESRDISLDFQSANFSFEAALKKCLSEKWTAYDVQKQEADPRKHESYKTFAERVKRELFGAQTEMKWDDVVQRSAELPSWIWYKNPGFQLEQLKSYMLSEKEWTDCGLGYISTDKPTVKSRCRLTLDTPLSDGSRNIRVSPIDGDTIYYAENAVATAESNRYSERDGLTTKAIWVSFLCVDSTGKNESASPLIWENTSDISMSEATDTETGKKLIVLSCNVEGVEIRYSMDGSNLPDATVYDKPIPVPEGEHILRAQAFAIREEDEDHLQANSFEWRVGVTVSGSRAVVEKGRKVFIRGTKSGCYDLGSTRAESLRTLACLGRHGATLRPQINIQPKDTSNSYVTLMLSGDGAPFLSADNVSELVNSICDKIYGSLDLVDVHIKAPDIKFEDGADFEAFTEEVQFPVDDFDYYQK